MYRIVKKTGGTRQKDADPSGQARSQARSTRAGSPDSRTPIRGQALSIGDSALGKKIRYFRQCKGLSQQKLADTLFWSRSFLSKIETGRKDPSSKDLDRLCKILGCDKERF